MANDFRREDLLEECLKPAFEARAEQLAAEHPSDDLLEDPHTFSPEFQAKMAAMTRKAARGRRPLRRYVQAAAMFVLCFAALGFGAMQVEAIRTPILRFVVSVTQEYTNITFDGGSNKELPASYEEIAPGYIPEGYELREQDLSEWHCYASYENPATEGYFSYMVMSTGGSSTSFDTEDCRVYEANINGRKAYVSVKLTRNTVIIVMFDQDFTYTLAGDLSEEEALAVMESVP